MADLMDQVRYVDLFCGIGAFHEAFSSQSWMECVFACDIDEGAREVYEVNYGIKPHQDIRTVKEGEMPDFDILCAGFPCQPFSIAGVKKGFDDDESGNLFFEIMRIVRAKKPRLCLLENVKNLCSHDGGRTFQVVKQSLEDEGYRVAVDVLNSAKFGSPQARQRVFIAASLNRPFQIPSGETGPPCPVRRILSEGDDITTKMVWNPAGYRLEKVQHKENTRGEQYKPKILYRIHNEQTGKGGRQGERVYDPDHVGITVCASSGGPGAKTGLYSIGSVIRRLSVGETIRMFGFPETFRFPAAWAHDKCLHYLGNSIVVDVIKAFIPSVKSYFHDD